MSKRIASRAFLLIAMLVHGGAARAQSPAPPAAGAPAGAQPAGVDRSRLRLYQRFYEDAVVARGGWVEGQYVYANLPDGTRQAIGPLIAFRVTKDMEAGLRFGFLDLNDGTSSSGMSDLDLYYKYRFRGEGRARFAVGTVVKMPTAEKTEGLGTGALDVEAFGALRADFDGASLVVNGGARMNGDPDPPLPGGKISYLAGGGILLPMSRYLTFAIEASWESARFEGEDPDGRLTVGLQGLAPQAHGGWRGAVAVPLTDGAPDFGALFGVFFSY